MFLILYSKLCITSLILGGEKKKKKTSAVSATDGWLKLNFASCVVRRTHSLGVLVLCSICNMAFEHYIYDVVVDTQFHKFHGRPFARVLYVFLTKYISRCITLVSS